MVVRRCPINRRLSLRQFGGIFGGDVPDYRRELSMTVGFQLTARKVGTIKATGKKQVFTDGNGLRLIVEPTGGKRWLLRRMSGGKDREFGLGGYPAVSLDDARSKGRHCGQAQSCRT